MIEPALSSRLVLPAIAAPMTAVSGPALVIAACRRGVIGSFPTHNAPSTAVLGDWLDEIDRQLAAESSGIHAPVAPNLVVHRTNSRLAADLAVLVARKVELVITSVGSPTPVVSPLHDAGCAVFADVASLRHVQRAIDAGVDGLVLLAAGAGGQTGWVNPFAFVRAVRAQFDGTIVLAGGISDGASMLAAQVLGADLVYLGTRLLATDESLASPEFKAAVIASTLDDVVLSSAIGGLPASVLSRWLEQSSAEEDGLPGEQTWPTGFRQDRLERRRTAWTAGHSVSGVDSASSLDSTLDLLEAQYSAAREALTPLSSTTPHSRE